MFESIVSYCQYWWDLVINYYQVNPFIFVGMYSVKSVIFWWTVILIVQRALKRQWDSLPGLVLLNVSTNVSPWVYVWVCGKNQPFWYPYMVYFVGGWGVCYLAWDVNRRLKLHQEKSAGTVTPSSSQESVDSGAIKATNASDPGTGGVA